jgi:hypothetical protein
MESGPKTSDVEEVVQRRRLVLLGHVIRTDKTRMAKKICESKVLKLRKMAERRRK